MSHRSPSRRVDDPDADSESDSEVGLLHREGMLGRQFREAEVSRGVPTGNQELSLKCIEERLESLGKYILGDREESEKVPREFRKEWIEPILRSVKGAKGFSLVHDDCFDQVNAVVSYLTKKASAIFNTAPRGPRAMLKFLKAFPVEKVLELIGIDLISENYERFSRMAKPFKKSSQTVTDVARKLIGRPGSTTTTSSKDNDQTRLLRCLSRSHERMSERKVAIYGFNTSQL